MADAEDLVDLVEQARRPGQRQLAEVEVEDFAVEEIEGVPAGGEGPDGIWFGLGDGLEELTDLGQAQLARVTLAVEQDEAAVPVGEGGDRGLGMAKLPCCLANLFEQTRRGRGGRGGARSLLMGGSSRAIQ